MARPCSSFEKECGFPLTFPPKLPQKNSRSMMLVRILVIVVAICSLPAMAESEPSRRALPKPQTQNSKPYEGAPNDANISSSECHIGRYPEARLAAGLSLEFKFSCFLPSRPSNPAVLWLVRCQKKNLCHAMRERQNPEPCSNPRPLERVHLLDRWESGRSPASFRVQGLLLFLLLGCYCRGSPESSA